MIPAIWTGMYAEAPLHDAIRILHACGWRTFEIATEHLAAIETADDPEALIEKTRKCLRGLGAFAPQAHAYLQANVADSDELRRERDVERLCRHIDIAARLGVRDVVVHPGGRRSDTPTEQARNRELNVEALRRLGDFAAERGVRICLENVLHPGATTPAELLDLLEHINHSAIGINLDTSHAHMSGLDVPQVIRELGPVLFATHISDNDRSGDQHLTPGGGTIDWLSVMDAFREVNYQGLFNLEIPGERHAVPALREMKTRFALNVAEWLISLAD